MVADLKGSEGSVPVRLIVGLLVAALGLIFLAENLGLADGRDLFERFWPAAFVAVGVAMLLQPRSSGPHRAWGALPIVAGCWIYAYQQEWIDVAFWDLFFPFVMLAFGASLVWRAYRAPRERPATADGPRESDDYVRAFAVMAGNEIRSSAHAFRGGDLGAFMGGVVLDLRNATLEGDTAVIDTFAMWAGIEIKVPAGWRVVSRVMPLMAAFEDKTPPPTAAQEANGTKTLIVRGLVVMGGIEVHG